MPPALMRSVPARLAPILARAESLLGSRRVPLYAALVAVLLTSPSLFGGLATEDWVQQGLVLHDPKPLAERVNLFGHARPWSVEEIAARNREYQLYGWFPWLTSPRFDASFWRPLASLTHHLDYRAWPEHPWVMHAESLLWYGALAWAVAWLYRRLGTPSWAAGAAAVLYAADDAHGHAVGWIINRNAVMAAVFAVLALYVYEGGRRHGKRWAGALTAILFGLALCSAEIALCMVGYFVAHAVFLDRDPFVRRARAQLSWILPTLGWAFVYRRLGHTTRGSGLYIDPLADSVAYAFEFFERGAVLLMGQLGAPFADVWTRAGTYGQGLLTFWAAMFTWFSAWMLWPLVREDRSLCFWAFGLLLSLPPACATFCEDRLLFFAGLGAMPLVVAFASRALAGALPEGARRRPALAFAAFLVVVHGVLGPLLLPYRSLHMARYEARIREAGNQAFSGQLPGALQAILVVNGEDFYFTGMMPLTRVSRKELSALRMFTLSGTLEPTLIRRIDDRTLEVRPKDGFLSRVFNRIYRGRATPLLRGGKFDLDGVDVQVLDVNQWGEPLRASFRFELPLEHPVFRWVVFRKGRYEPFPVPPVGTEVVVGET